MKLEGVKRKGNTITIACNSRKEANWILDEIVRHLGTYRFISGAQWTDKQIKEMCKVRIKGTPKKDKS